MQCSFHEHLPCVRHCTGAGTELTSLKSECWTESVGPRDCIFQCGGSIRWRVISFPNRRKGLIIIGCIILKSIFSRAAASGKVLWKSRCRLVFPTWLFPLQYGERQTKELSSHWVVRTASGLLGVIRFLFGDKHCTGLEELVFESHLYHFQQCNL